MPPPPLGEVRKHSNHLRMIELMMRDRAPGKVADAPSMKEAFRVANRLSSLLGVGESRLLPELVAAALVAVALPTATGALTALPRSDGFFHVHGPSPCW